MMPGAIAALPNSTVRLLRQSVTLNDLPTLIAQLCWNSIDANATSIEVAINISQSFVRVADNGFGIAACDFAVLFEPFHSSKSYGSAATIGWRGSSLNAIRSTCGTLQITSKPAATSSSSSSSRSTTAATQAYFKTVRGQDVVECGHVADNASPLPFPHGTVVRVSQVFENLAVRRKMMMADPSKTLNSVARQLGRALLAFPHVQLKVIDLSSNSVALRMPTERKDGMIQRFCAASRLPRLAEALTRVSHRSRTTKSKPKSKSSSSMAVQASVSGVVGMVLSSQPISRSNQILFLNGRPVSNGDISACVEQALAKEVAALASTAHNAQGAKSRECALRSANQRVHVAYLLSIELPRTMYYPLEGKVVAEACFRNIQLVLHAVSAALSKRSSTGRSRKRRSDPLLASLSSTTTSSSSSSSSSVLSHDNANVQVEKKRKLAQMSKVSLDLEASRKRAANPYAAEPASPGRISPFSLHACNQVMDMFEKGLLDQQQQQNQRPPILDFSGFAPSSSELGVCCDVKSSQSQLPVPSSLQQQTSSSSSSSETSKQPMRASVASLHYMWSQSRSQISARPHGNRTNATLCGTMETNVGHEFKTESQKLERSMLAGLRVLGQADCKFIVCVSQDGLLVALDQHASHERVLLETFESTPTDFERKHLNPPVLLKWSAADLADVLAHRNLLAHFGFELDLRDLEHVLLTGVPSVKGAVLQADDLLEYVWRLRECVDADAGEEETNASSAVIPPAFRRVWASKACRSAIMFGDVLTNAECETLLSLLLECKFPFNCAHGRPTMVPLVRVFSPKEAVSDHATFAMRMQLGATPP